MEIYSGIDIVDIRRFERTLARYGERFTERIFTGKELAAVRGRRKESFYLSVSFSFKEAVWKAMPEKMQKDFYFRDIEILWKRRKPSVTLKGEQNPPGLAFHYYTTEKHAVTTAIFISSEHRRKEQ